MPRHRASVAEILREGISTRIIAEPPQADTLEEKLKFWANSYRYDPFGRYGKPAHPGQMKAHSAIADPEVKVVVIRAGKQSGKSTCAEYEADYALHRHLNVWAASATLDLAKRIFNPVFERALASSRLKPVVKDRRRLYLEIEGGGLLAGKSWGEKDQLEATPVSVVIGDEAQKLDEDSFYLLYARTINTKGKVILLGSEQESSEFFDWACETAGEFGEGYKDWRFVQWRTADNPGADLEALAQAKATMSADRYAALFEGQKRPNYELVFPDFRKDLHIRELEFLPQLPVTLWIDPGYNFYSVLAVQFGYEEHIGEVVRVFDEVYLNQVSTAKVIEEVRKRPWWYRVKEIVIDVAANQHNANAEHTVWQEWDTMTKMAPRCQVVGIKDGIERTRTALRDPANGRPRMFFDRANTTNTQEEFLHGYKYRKPRGADRPHSDLPIDRLNHSCKAIAYGLTDRFGLTGFNEETPEQMAAARTLKRESPFSRWARSFRG